MSRLNLFVIALIFSVASTATPAPSLSDIDTSGWKNYRNEKMGFEAKYPNAWHVRPVTGTGPVSVLLNETPQVGKANLSMQFWVQRQVNPQGLSIAQWYADQLQGIKSTPPPSTHTILGGRPTIRREAVRTLGRHFDFFTALNKTDVFEVTITQPSSQAQLNQIYEAILSTVIFIN